MFYRDFKIGMLGGGQLGRMLIQAGIDFNLNFSVMDSDPNAPCASFTKDFAVGSLTDFDQVMAFGKGKDLITIEIENVNTEALQKLQDSGVKVFPQPEIIKIIQDKREQKKFYQEKGIPTAEFVLVDSKEALKALHPFFPAVQKLGKAGYDGRGVYKINSVEDVETALEGPCLVEKLIDFEKEVSVLVARNEKGAISTFPIVEMVFHPEKNLVEYLFAPAHLSAKQEESAKEIACEVIRSLGMVGLLAVEMFIDSKGEVLVNEVAPRPHNSGHQTIKGNRTSQYEQHLRAILNLPLGDTALLSPVAMVNLLGEEGYEGKVIYEGVEEVLAQKGIYLHLYGKMFTKPYRKMGHVTILEEDLTLLKKKVFEVKNCLKVIA